MSTREASGVTSESEASSESTGNVSILEAIRFALIDAMASDDRVIILGEDVGRLGGVFRVTKDLQAKFGVDRVVDTPLAEGAIIGASIGLAIGGMIPVPEIQFLGFTPQAFHQIGPQLARFRARSRGRYPMPVTIRVPSGGGVRTPEFHADAIESLFCQTPGVKVVCPAFADDAYGLLSLSIQDPDPVLFIEPQRLYRSVHGPIYRSVECLPFGRCKLIREGADVTLIAWSAGVHLCLEAARVLESDAISAAVVDLRTLIPLDVTGLVDCISANRRAVIVHEAPYTAGFGAEIAATIHEFGFMWLDAPVLRVAAPDVPYPPGDLEDHFLPSIERVVRAVRKVVAF